VPSLGERSEALRDQYGAHDDEENRHHGVVVLVSSVFEKHGVRMGVRRRAAAQQYQRLLLAGPQLVNNAGRNDNAVACSHWALFVT
jgi:hypothetical protein